MKNLLLTVSLGPLYKQLERITHPTIASYAKKIGADFISIDESHELSNDVKIKQDLYFTKLNAINKYFSKYKRIAFIDTDIIIREDAPNIFDVVDEDKIGIFNEGKYANRSEFSHLCKSLKVDLDNWKGTYYNTGVMVIPRRYANLFKSPEFYQNFTNEQPYLNIIFHTEKVDIQMLHYDFNRMELIDKFIGISRLNSYFVHYAGAPEELIVGLIQKDINTWSVDSPNFTYKRDILIEVSGGMGDQFCSEPVIRCIKKLYPNDRITIVTHFKRLFLHIDDISIYEYKDFKGLGEDVIPLKMYTCPSEEHSNHDLSHALFHPTDFSSLSMIKRTLPNIDKTYNVSVNPDDISSVLEKIGTTTKPTILIHAGKWWSSKTLPIHWWQKVVDLLSEEFTPILIGKTIDKKQGFQDIDCPDGGVDLRDITTLDELIALISITPCLLSNDSSPIHLAGAFDNWIVVIPTCKHPDHILPWRNGTQNYKTKPLYKKLIIDDLEIRHTEFFTDTIDFLPKDKKIDEYLPEPEEVFNEICSIYKKIELKPIVIPKKKVKKKLKKTIHILNVDDYFPELTKVTFPLIEKWAKKIGANVNYINKRKYPNHPVTYEKLQVYEMGKKSDWNILIDADFIITNDAPDITLTMKEDVVYIQYEFHASNQFKSNNIFKSDHRDIGIAGGFIVTSKLTHDLWKPLDIDIDEIKENPPLERWHILDEYTLSLNIAKNKYKKDGIGYIDKFIHIGVEGESKEKVLEKCHKILKNCQTTLGRSVG